MDVTGATMCMLIQKYLSCKAKEQKKSKNKEQ